MKIGSMLLKVILALVVIIGISSCTKPGSTTVAQSNVEYYTCTMHPSVHSKTPGKCPICSMDLVPVLKKVANDTGPQDNSIEAGKGTPGAKGDTGRNDRQWLNGLDVNAICESAREQAG